MEERIYWPSLGTERADIVGEGRKWCDFIGNGKDRGVIPLQCCALKRSTRGFVIILNHDTIHLLFLCFTGASMHA